MVFAAEREVAGIGHKQRSHHGHTIDAGLAEESIDVGHQPVAPLNGGQSPLQALPVLRPGEKYVNRRPHTALRFV